MGSTTSANLTMPHVDQGQKLPEVDHNEAINIIDALIHLAPEDRALSTPPGSPSNGETWIVGASPSGDWSTASEHDVAIYVDGWIFKTPQEGWHAWPKDEDVEYTFDGTSWVLADEQSGNVKTTGNTISTQDANGDLNLSPNGSGSVVINAGDAAAILAKLQAAASQTGDLLQALADGGAILFAISETGELTITADQTQDNAINDDTTPKKLTLQKLAAAPTNAPYIAFTNNPGTDTFYLVLDEA